MSPLLRFLLIIVKASKFEKVSLNDRQISGLSFNTLAADQKHSLLNRENLMQPIGMQLSLKGKTFSQFFFGIIKMQRKFQKLSKKKITFIVDVFPKLRIHKKVV